MKKVVMYTGNPCPYCVYARALLDSKKIPYQEINVWEDESKRAEMLKKSGGRTSVPQIFIGDHHVGGNDELQAANLCYADECAALVAPLLQTHFVPLY